MSTYESISIVLSSLTFAAVLWVLNLLRKDASLREDSGETGAPSLRSAQVAGHSSATAMAQMERLLTRMDPTARLQEDLDVVANMESVEELDVWNALADRHPGSDVAVGRLFDLLASVAEADPDLLARREAVLRLKEVADKFRLESPMEKLSLAMQFQGKVAELADGLMVEVGKTRRESLAQTIGQLESLVESMKGLETPDEEALNEIAAIDGSLDRDALNQFADLKTRYDAVSTSLIQLLDTKDDRDSRRAYSMLAVESAREALNQFEQGKGFLAAEKYDVARLAQLLGGWEQQHLLPAAHTYVASVYAEIFQKLKPDERLAITEKMIRAEPKPSGGTAA